MYQGIRFCIVLIIFLLCTIFLRKRIKKHQGIALAICTLSCILLYSALYFLPFENRFVSFPSAEAAFHYYQAGEVSEIINGENCDLLIYQKGDAISFALVGKNKKGWLTGPQWKNTRSQPISTTQNLYIISNAKESDCFVLIFNAYSEQEISLSDSENSTFQTMTIHEHTSDTDSAIYYTHIPKCPEDYHLFYDGQMIKIVL